jgi:hypothetical protein
MTLIRLLFIIGTGWGLYELFEYHAFAGMLALWTVLAVILFLRGYRKAVRTVIGKKTMNLEEKIIELELRLDSIERKMNLEHKERKRLKANVVNFPKN